MTAGGFDYLLKIRSRSMADFGRFLGNRLITLPGLQQTHSYFVMEVVKSHARLNLSTTAPITEPHSTQRAASTQGGRALMRTQGRHWPVRSSLFWAARRMDHEVKFLGKKRVIKAIEMRDRVSSWLSAAPR